MVEPGFLMVAISMNAGDPPSVPFRNGAITVLPEMCTSGSMPIELAVSPLLVIASDATTVPV